jgi:hypothetical protein
MDIEYIRIINKNEDFYKKIINDKYYLIDILRNGHIEFFNNINRNVKQLGLKIDLTNIMFKFTGVDLSNIDFTGVDLRDTYFTETKFKGALLNYGANYRGAKLEGANIDGFIVNSNNLKELMINNGELILTKEYCIENRLCIEGIEAFMYSYKLPNKITLKNLLKYKYIKDMYNNKYFVNIVLKLCKII